MSGSRSELCFWARGYQRVALCLLLCVVGMMAGAVAIRRYWSDNHSPLSWLSQSVPRSVRGFLRVSLYGETNRDDGQAETGAGLSTYRSMSTVPTTPVCRTMTCVGS